MRALSQSEQQKLQTLTEKSVSVALLELTETGIKKSIMDATGPVRNYLLDHGFHDYATQLQGPENKVVIDAVLISGHSVSLSSASLYRPVTKKGDPRIWFRGLKDYVTPGDIIAIVGHENKLFVFNLTTLPVVQLIQSSILNPLRELAESIFDREDATAQELLILLREVASRGPIEAALMADTAVGRTLETALGIDINSSKQPDYKGIELKSYRNKKGNRKTLFAQVADWKLSKFKNSAEILDAFGYDRGNDFKLYCTVAANTWNSQGLRLRIDSNINQMLEQSNRLEIGDFAVWTLEKLHERLLEKHRETFWIAADSVKEDGKEYFQYKSVEHTKKPIVSQFDLLLSQGIITMDHLIKRNEDGVVNEKGPLFKIKPNCLNLLFPPSEKYSLLV